MLQPASRHILIRQIPLVERHNARLIADDFPQHRIRARRWNPSVKKLDDDIDKLQILLHQFPRLLHMSRIPLDDGYISRYIIFIIIHIPFAP